MSVSSLFDTAICQQLFRRLQKAQIYRTYSTIKDLRLDREFLTNRGK